MLSKRPAQTDDALAVEWVLDSLPMIAPSDQPFAVGETCYGSKRPRFIPEVKARAGLVPQGLSPGCAGAVFSGIVACSCVRVCVPVSS